MRKFIIDSNILIEYFKGNEKAKGIVDITSNDKSNSYLISIDTLEEILYILVRHFSQKPYWELKNKPEKTKDVYEILLPLIDSIVENFFQVIDTPSVVKTSLFEFCKNYGMLPKDALLSSLAIHYQVDFLITLDKDFSQLDFIKIVNSSNDLRKIIEKESRK